MPRSAKKPPYVPEYLVKKVEHAINNNLKAPIKVWCRAAVILPIMVGFTFAVHNGKNFVPVFVTPALVGKKLGEFALTRSFKGHVGNKKGK